MKKNSIFLAGLASLALALGLAGCPTDSGTSGTDPVKYTVTFDANGGTPATQTAEVETGKTATLPTDPTNATAGQTFFQGWYTKDGSGNWGSRFTEATPVTANITVYAKWGGAAPIEYTATPRAVLPLPPQP
jgi:hypothetical protein